MKRIQQPVIVDNIIDITIPAIDNEEEIISKEEDDK